MKYAGSALWGFGNAYDETEDVHAETDPTDFDSWVLRLTLHGVRYRVSLRPTQGRFVGTWSAMRILVTDGDSPDDEGLCEAKVFKADDGEIILGGTWEEDRELSTWVVFLKPSTGA